MSKDITAELRNALYGRSSVFIGSLETPTERIVYHILYETIHEGKTVIWICLRDSPNTIFDKFSFYKLPISGMEDRLWFVDATITGNRTITPQTSRCPSIDYACIIMEVGRMLKHNPVSLVMFDHIGIIAALDSFEVIVRPFKYLDTLICSKGGGFMTLIANKIMPGGTEAGLLGLIDAIIRIKEDTIHASIGSKEFCIPFCFSGTELILGSKDSEKDLKELFSLTPEEKKQLELEVEEKAQIYRETTD